MNDIRRPNSERGLVGSNSPTQRPLANGRKRPEFWIWTVGLALAAVQFTWALPHFTIIARAGAVGVLLLCVWSVSIWLRKREVRGLVLVAACGQLYLGYAISQFSRSELPLSTGSYAPPEAALEKAACGALLGGVFFVLGWQLGGKTGFRQGGQFRSQLILSSTRMLPLLLHLLLSAALMLGEVIGAVSLPFGIRTPITFVMNPYISWALIVVIRRQRTQPSIPSWFYGLAVVLSMPGLAVASTAAALTPWAFLALVRLNLTRQVPVGWMILGLCAVIAFNETKGQYRRTSAYRDASRGEMVELQERREEWKAAAIEAQGGGVGQQLATFLERTAEDLALAQVIDWVPSSVPYRAGKNLEWLVLFSVPRVLLPSKPGNMELFNVEYGLSFGRLSPADQSMTRVGISAPGEGYWHFGWLGLCLFSLVHGLVLGALYNGDGYPLERDALASISLSSTPFPIGTVLYLVPSTLAFVAAFLIVMVGLGWLGRGSRVGYRRDKAELAGSTRVLVYRAWGAGRDRDD